MAPGLIGPTATAPSMASLATIDTSSSVYAPTQLLNWVYLTLADQNQTCSSDQVPVSSADSLRHSVCMGGVGVWLHGFLSSARVGGQLHPQKTKLHGLSPRANYTDRATAACRRSDCQRADRGCHVVSVTDPYGRILGFLDRSCYFSIK
jgi:hypothetical protein